MDRDEQRPDHGPDQQLQEGAEPPAAAEPTEERAEEAQALEQLAVEAARERPRGELPRYVQTAMVLGALLLFALAFFLAGFWVHAQLEEDGGDGGTTASASDDPAWGPKDAAVTIQEFGDFQCPYCGSFAREIVPTLRATYEDKVRYVYRDFPLVSIHEFAQKAAEAAQCAHEQGLFWEYHDRLFADQEALAVPDLKRYAEQVGADTGEFNQCLDSGEKAWEVMLDVQDGAKAGVNSTPSFLVNGVLLSGAVPFQQFQAIIDQALAGAGD
ncbi:MAG: hypothetical protein A2148_10655 [Chloroflexi bacterium RBG_16_68_14]|nr:MAG: hypothetical protein A2148_10655 [Chloroflexi bacterium RBG_16_68_14]